MYKKLHTPEKEPSAEPFCDKGSFLWCVPERDIMLTKDVWSIHLENRKKPISSQSKEVGFSALLQGYWLMPHGVLSSLLNIVSNYT